MITLPHKFHVKNDEDGRAFIRVLRKMIKPQGKRLVLRGRGHRFGKAIYQPSLPHCLSTSFAVYVESKHA